MNKFIFLHDAVHSTICCTIAMDGDVIVMFHILETTAVDIVAPSHHKCWTKCPFSLCVCNSFSHLGLF